MCIVPLCSNSKFCDKIEIYLRDTDLKGWHSMLCFCLFCVFTKWSIYLGRL